MRPKFYCFVLMLTSAGLISGCGQKSGLDLPTGTVAGKVTSGGKPISDATITFFGENHGDTATAALQDDGTYTLKYGTGFGIPVGDYRVAITAGAAASSSAAANPEDLMKTVDAGEASESKIPPKYSDPQTSGFIAVVKEGSNSGVDFDME